MKKTLFVTIILAAALALTACGTSTPTQPTAVSTTPTVNALIAEGTLLPINTLDQSFSVPGQVAEVFVHDGEVVSIGQALMKLKDSPEAELVLARANQEVLAAQQALDSLKGQADLNLAKADLAVIAAQTALDNAQEAFDADNSEENQAKLDKAAAELKLAEDAKGKISGSGIDPDALAAAEARLETAQAALTSATAAVENLTLKATVDGTVVDLAVQPGQRVSVGSPVVTLADVSQWVVKTDNLTEINVADVSLGQQVEIVLDALPDAVLKGEVTHINARFEEKRGDITYTVTIKLLDTDPRLRWGMTAAVKFVR